MEKFENDDVEELLVAVQQSDFLKNRTKRIMWSAVKYKELQMMYLCAIKEVRTKFEVLDTEFNLRHKRNPISSIQTRLKRTDSIFEKMERKNLPMTLESLEENINDVAGIRVICSYIDDIYEIADALIRQDDITLLEKKDYIEHPKPNGYRSLHLIVKVPVFFTDRTKEMKVEVQIRTIAMDFWASLEHQIKYKKEICNQSEICRQLKECADVIAETDRKMLNLRAQIDGAEETQTEEELLFERFRKLDMPIA